MLEARDELRALGKPLICFNEAQSNFMEINLSCMDFLVSSIIMFLSCSNSPPPLPLWCQDGRSLGTNCCFFQFHFTISSRKSPFHFVMERVPRRWSQRAPDVWFVSPSRAPFCRVSRSICNMSGVIGNMQHAAEGSRSRSYESINTKVCKSYLKGKTAFKVKYLGLDWGLALVSISYLSKLSDCCVFWVIVKADLYLKAEKIRPSLFKNPFWG